MWSVGCILGELYIGKALFPGHSTINQIERILQLTGKPSQKDIESIDSTMAGNIINTISNIKKKSLAIFFPHCSEDALDLIKNLLKFNAKDRLTAEQALEHKYVRDFHDKKDEIVCEKPIGNFFLISYKYQ